MYVTFHKNLILIVNCFYKVYNINIVLYLCYLNKYLGSSGEGGMVTQDICIIISDT